MYTEHDEVEKEGYILWWEGEGFGVEEKEKWGERDQVVGNQTRRRTR